METKKRQRDPLAELASGVERIEQRVEALSKGAAEQTAKVATAAGGEHNLFDSKNVAEACGVMGSEPDKLIYDTPRTKAPARSKSDEEAAKREKKRRQRLGGSVYTGFCATFMALMWCAFNDMLPVFEWERMPLESILAVATFLSDNMYVPFVLAGVYVALVFGTKRALRDREGFDLKYALTAWSLALAAFSVAGALRTVPTLFKMAWSRGLYHTLCGDTRYDWLVMEPAGTWTVFFIFSKVPELVDTAFIVLRKRKLITLHWYHHITVMLFCWHSLATLCLNGLIFSAMNLTVHSMMYFFYALTAMGYRPTQYAMYITCIQILQMMVGTAVTVYVNYHENFVTPQTFESPLNTTWDIQAPMELQEDECHVHPVNAASGLAMYASYLWLFCTFFYVSYVRPTSVSPKTKTA